MTASQPRSFGELLRGYRVKAGLTQEALAERARMSLAAIGKLERGARQRPYRPTIALLADALSLSPSDRFELERAGRGERSFSSTRPDADQTVKIPTYLSSFVGREEDVAVVCDMLGSHRLVTLVGAAGIGKTRLAVRAAQQFVSQTTTGRQLDGAWFVDFSSIGSDKMIAMALASGIGVDGYTTVKEIVSSLRSQMFLLILDNCEHLLDPIAAVANDLIFNCPGARLVATSRQALSLDGERIYQVPPLSLADAIHLFKDRAEAVDSRFQLTDSIATAVTDICQRVDGIALGIELAAARTNAFSPSSIAQQIADHFQLLAGGLRTSPTRHQTIGSLFDWSYDLLDGAAQELFRRSSVFVGGFTLDLICALYSGDERRDIPLLLASLVDKSLVQSDIGVEPTRYRLLEPAREYAREKLRDRGEMDHAARSHALALLALAEDFDSRRALIPDTEWDNYIERERDNFRAAFEWALGPHGDAIVGLQLVGSKTAAWGSFKSGEIRRLMDIAVVADDGSAPPHVRARFALGVARAAVIYGYSWQPGSDSEDRINACRRALTSQLSGDSRSLATAQLWLGVALQTAGRYEEAESVLRETRDRFSALGIETDYCFATTTLGSARFGAGDMVEARQLISESLQLCEDAGSNRVAADARAGLAEIEFASGNIEKALQLAQETTQFFRSRSNYNALPMSLGNAAAYFVAMGRYPEARDAALETLHWSRAMGNMHSAFWAMQHLTAAAVLSNAADDRALLRRAANILGFVDASTERRGIPRYHTEQQEYDKILIAISSVLGVGELKGLMAGGRAWSEEQALAECIAISEQA